MNSELDITEELDFHYLLGLMQPLHDVDGFAWLPELFSIIGHERLILLAKYAGGEKIQIPTLDELGVALNSLQWFYDIDINHTKQLAELPKDYVDKYNKIKEVYNAINN